MRYYKTEIEIKGTIVTVLETGEVINLLEGKKAVVLNKKGEPTTAYENKAAGWMLFLNDAGTEPVLSRWAASEVSVDIQALL